MGAGSTVNEVKFTYNDFGQSTKTYQAHAGAVDATTTPSVQMGYANGSANTVRPTSRNREADESHLPQALGEARISIVVQTPAQRSYR